MLTYFHLFMTDPIVFLFTLLGLLLVTFLGWYVVNE
jgi:hypothetical protein